MSVNYEPGQFTIEDLENWIDQLQKRGPALQEKKECFISEEAAKAWPLSFIRYLGEIFTLITSSKGNEIIRERVQKEGS